MAASRVGLLGLMGLAAVCCGCTGPRQWWHNGLKVGPSYCAPAAATAPEWLDAGDARVQTSPPDDARWWTVFHDPALDRLVHIAYQQNLPLREAAMRIVQARSQRAVAAGNLLPQQQQAFADYARNAVSTTTANRQQIQQQFFDVWDGGFNLAWELDFWGKFRRAIEAADAQWSASIDDYDAVLVLLLSDVAGTYSQVRILEARLEYARTNLALQQQTLEKVRERRKEGALSELDLSQAATNVRQTESSIPPLEIALRQASNRLCTLLGVPPEDLEEALRGGPIPAAPSEVAVGIPADLLWRRPDVRRSERQLAAQCAQVGVATAALYPQIAITGTIGLESSQLSQIGKPESMFGNIGPSLRWDILNYGRLLARIRGEDARFQELAARYLNTVLTANQEVEDALVAFLRSQEQVKSQVQAAEEARKAVDLDLLLWKEGKVDVNRTYVLQRTRTEMEDQLAQAQGNVVLGLIQVYRALGGGWQIRRGTAATIDEQLEGPAVGPQPPDPLPAPRPLADPLDDVEKHRRQEGT